MIFGNARIIPFYNLKHKDVTIPHSSGIVYIGYRMRDFNFQEIGIRVCQILVVILAAVYVYLILSVLYVIAPMDIPEQLVEV